MNTSFGGVRFIRLTEAYIPAVVSMEKDFFHTPWSAEQYAQAFCQKHFSAYGLIASEDTDNTGHLIAYIAFYHILDELEILNIAVSLSQRNQGLGRYLLKTTLQEAHKMGIRRAVLEVRTGNTAARKLYEGLAFVCVGTRRAYYADTGEDALIYEAPV